MEIGKNKIFNKKTPTINLFFSIKRNMKLHLKQTLCTIMYLKWVEN